MLISEDLLHPKEGPACLSLDLCEKRHLQEESGTIPVDKQTPKSSSKVVFGLPHVFAVVKGSQHRGPKGFCEGWGLLVPVSYIHLHATVLHKMIF